MSAVESPRPPAAPLTIAHPQPTRLVPEPEQPKIADQSKTDSMPIDTAMQRWLDLNA